MLRAQGQGGGRSCSLSGGDSGDSEGRDSGEALSSLTVHQGVSPCGVSCLTCIVCQASCLVLCGDGRQIPGKQPRPRREGPQESSGRADETLPEGGSLVGSRSCLPVSWQVSEPFLPCPGRSGTSGAPG